MRRLLSPFILFLTRFFFPFRVYGLNNVPANGPVLLVSNHPSYLDPVLLIGVLEMYAGRKIHFMAWDKLFRLPLVGALCRIYEAFPVSLKRPTPSSLETMLEKLRKGGIVGIFPEGGRSQSAFMGKWKPGALSIAASVDPLILPVTVLGMDRAWPAAKLLPRLFQPITILFHPARKISSQGKQADTLQAELELSLRRSFEQGHQQKPGKPEAQQDDPETSKHQRKERRRWLQSVGEELRAEINQAFEQRRLKEEKKAFDAYQKRTPAEFRYKWFSQRRERMNRS